MAAQYALASPEQMGAAMPHKTGHGLLWTIAALVVAVVAVLMGIGAYASGPSPTICRAACAPPQASPLLPPHRYVSSKYGYSVDYYDSDSATLDLTIDDGSSVGWQVQQNPNYLWEFSGFAANGESADQIVRGVHDGTYPSAQLVYAIQGAEIGYTPAAGNVYDLYTNNGQSTHLRVFILAAVKRGLAVAFIGQGEYKPNVNYGHPNPSLTPAPVLFDASLNSVRWPGDPQL